ncbi:MAG: anti-sigma factor [Solirubrobacterales bacterium]
MNEKEHQAHRDELAAYLLGALEPGDAAALEQHLAGCGECRAELEWLRPAALSLPESVDPADPPAALRARIMGEIGTDAKPERATGGFGWQRRSPGLRPLAGLAVVALLAAAVAGYAIRDGGDGGPDATTVAVGQPPAVTAEMVREGDNGTLRLENLHQLPADEILQAWVQRGERVESAKTLFVPNADGTATAVIGEMDGVDAVMVTAEPRGGSEQPTGEPIVAVALPQ